MKILFTADWHIKLGQKNVPVEWQKNRYTLLFAELNRAEADLMIIGGDIFDRVPTLEELEIFWTFVIGCNKKTLVYSGNHEAVGKHTTFLSLMRNTVRYLNNKVEIIDDITLSDDYVIIPYNKLKKWAETKDQFNVSYCFTHVRGEIPPHVTPEVDLTIFDPFVCVFAGDLHSHSNSQRNIVYPGSPLTTSFHRNLVDTGYILIDTKEGWDWIKLDIPQLLKLTVDKPEDMVKTDFHHTIYELHGDLLELSKVENQELLDKKVIKTTSESALILTKDMSIEDEMSEFMLYILNLDEKQVKDLLKVYHDYVKNS